MSPRPAHAAFIFSYTIALAVLGLYIMSLVGCASTATQVRKQIASDLTAIADQQDCASSCEALKLYIKTKLRGL